MGKVRTLLFGEGYDPYEGLEVLPFNGHGWASTSPVFAEVIAHIRPKLIVEVGTWMGGSARHMASIAAQYQPDVEVVCIDTFLGSVEHWDGSSYSMVKKNGRPNIYEQFLSNNVHTGLTKYITPFPVDSINGFLVLQKFNVVPDLIYVDAGHDYESVRKDLERWSTLLRAGGVLIGDDFHHPPIIQAVQDVFNGAHRSSREKFIWIKPQDQTQP